jgi:hypothetical protein
MTGLAMPLVFVMFGCGLAGSNAGLFALGPRNHLGSTHPCGIDYFCGIDLCRIQIFAAHKS